MSNLPIPACVSMTSREIAELTGKRHDHVLRDIKSILTQVYDLQDNPDLGYQSIQGVTAETDSHTKRTSQYILDKDHTLTLLTGYDAKARMRVIKRWQELESQVSTYNIPTTFAEALRLAADQAFKLEEQAKQIADLNTIIDNEFGYSSILRTATFLGIPETTFNWRPLKAMTLKIGLEVKKVPSPRYQYQLLYPIKAFEQCYPEYDFDDLQPEAISDKARASLTLVKPTAHDATSLEFAQNVQH